MPMRKMTPIPTGEVKTSADQTRRIREQVARDMAPPPAAAGSSPPAAREAPRD